jgi:hypothetical protein
VADGGATGLDCATIVNDALGELEKDVANDPNRMIDVVGFSRGSAQAVDFANIVQSDLSQGIISYNYYDSLTQAETVKSVKVNPGQVQIRFLGLYDLVTTIGGTAGDDGGLKETLPKGIGLVAHAVALSEEREKFEFTDLTQLNPNGDPLDQLGFRGAHSDVGGGATPGVNNLLTAETLRWMNSEALTGGWTTLDSTKEDLNTPSTLEGLTDDIYNNELPVHQIYAVNVGLGILYTYDLQYRNFAINDPVEHLQGWQPSGDILYSSQAPQFWNRNYLTDLSDSATTYNGEYKNKVQSENGA